MSTRLRYATAWQARLGYATPKSVRERVAWQASTNMEY
jgi:hypothetical protein